MYTFVISLCSKTKKQQKCYSYHLWKQDLEKLKRVRDGPFLKTIKISFVVSAHTFYLASSNQPRLLATPPIPQFCIHMLTIGHRKANPSIAIPIQCAISFCFIFTQYLVAAPWMHRYSSKLHIERACSSACSSACS